LKLIEKLFSVIGQLHNSTSTSVTNNSSSIISNGIVNENVNLNGTYLNGSNLNNSEIKREMQDLEREYFTFIGVIASNGLSQILVSEKNRPFFDTLVQSLLRGLENEDKNSVKSCLTIFKKFIELFPTVGFKNFILQQVLPGMLKIIQRQDFDLNDVGTSVLLGEIVAVQQVSFQKYREEMLVSMQGIILPSLFGQGPYIQQYLQQLQSPNQKEFREFFKNFAKIYRKKS